MRKEGTEPINPCSINHLMCHVAFTRSFASLHWREWLFIRAPMEIPQDLLRHFWFPNIFFWLFSSNMFCPLWNNSGNLRGIRHSKNCWFEKDDITTKPGTLCFHIALSYVMSKIKQRNKPYSSTSYSTFQLLQWAHTSPWNGLHPSAGPFLVLSSSWKTAFLAENGGKWMVLTAQLFVMQESGLWCPLALVHTSL